MLTDFLNRVSTLVHDLIYDEAEDKLNQAEDTKEGIDAVIDLCTQAIQFRKDESTIDEAERILSGALMDLEAEELRSALPLAAQLFAEWKDQEPDDELCEFIAFLLHRVACESSIDEMQDCVAETLQNFPLEPCVVDYLALVCGELEAIEPCSQELVRLFRAIIAARHPEWGLDMAENRAEELAVEVYAEWYADDSVKLLDLADAVLRWSKQERGLDGHLQEKFLNACLNCVVFEDVELEDCTKALLLLMRYDEDEDRVLRAFSHFILNRLSDDKAVGHMTEILAEFFAGSPSEKLVHGGYQTMRSKLEAGLHGDHDLAQGLLIAMMKSCPSDDALTDCLNSLDKEALSVVRKDVIHAAQEMDESSLARRLASLEFLRVACAHPQESLRPWLSGVLADWGTRFMEDKAISFEPKSVSELLAAIEKLDRVLRPEGSTSVLRGQHSDTWIKLLKQDFDVDLPTLRKDPTYEKGHFLRYALDLCELLPHVMGKKHPQLAGLETRVLLNAVAATDWEEKLGKEKGGKEVFRLTEVIRNMVAKRLSTRSVPAGLRVACKKRWPESF